MTVTHRFQLLLPTYHGVHVTIFECCRMCISMHSFTHIHLTKHHEEYSLNSGQRMIKAANKMTIKHDYFYGMGSGYRIRFFLDSDAV